jgi:hypothetical protein
VFKKKGSSPIYRQACGGKTLNRFAILSMLIPERHEGFAWAGLSRRSLQAKSDRPGKKFSLSAPALLNSALRTSSGGFNRVNLRLKYLLNYRIQRRSSAHSVKFHQLFMR